MDNAFELGVDSGSCGGGGGVGGSEGGSGRSGGGCEVRAAFLDWRDDQAALDGAGGGGDGSERTGSGGNCSGEGEGVALWTQGVMSRPEGVTSDEEDTIQEGSNWVHKLEGGGQAAAALPRLTADETFEVIVVGRFWLTAA